MAFLAAVTPVTEQTLRKEVDVTDPIDELVDHLNELLVDPDRDTLTLRADESGGLRLSWRSTSEDNVLSLDRIESHPRLGLVNAVRIMRKTVGR